MLYKVIQSLLSHSKVLKMKKTKLLLVNVEAFRGDADEIKKNAEELAKKLQKKLGVNALMISSQGPRAIKINRPLAEILNLSSEACLWSSEITKNGHEIHSQTAYDAIFKPEFETADYRIGIVHDDSFANLIF